ncbi:hypothetical protein EDD18DRAFT_82822 [Armillaria luteobubalina]|uniref:Uncharacterized protein n=1 Tax=Armillaria luteobubalina TaxID=153913 RepID=A0AA39Q983_9AGAR|nr:hypothetical protein EDD18DRAFT_82822 [Armillaria luteobubalina]
MAKDLIVGSKRHPKIKPFADIISAVSTITTYFSHSNYGQFWLRQELQKETDKRGIEMAGATRFSSFSSNAKSVQRCLEPMKHAYRAGNLKFNTKATKIIEKYLKDGGASMRFMAELQNVNALLTPIDRGLKTLEGQNVTCSDVFFVYIGIAIGFMCVFETNQDDECLLGHQVDTYNIFNRRFSILMTDSTSDMFLFAYFLDPVYYSDRALRLNLPPRPSFSKMIAPPLVMRLFRAALSMLENKQLRRNSGGKEQASELITQLTDSSQILSASSSLNIL